MPPRTEAKTTPQQIAELYEENRRLHTLVTNLTERVATLEAVSEDPEDESS